MGVLQSKQFTNPPDDRLNKCAELDAYHIVPGQRGDHVKRIQVALCLLRDIFLSIDGWYGPETAKAVKDYKNAQTPRITQPWQTDADDIVGIRTIRSLDSGMLKFEEPAPLKGFVSTTHLGDRHQHATCPKYTGGNEAAPDGSISHMATPIRPQRFGRMISIGGQGEVRYLGFEDFVPNPHEDSYMPASEVHGRPFTSSLPAGSVSDVCFRSAPIDRYMRRSELSRIAAVGCRLTFAGGNIPGGANINNLMPFFLSLGPILQDEIIFEDEYPLDEYQARRVVVVTMLLHKRR